jgi:hypothetical protein
MENMKTPFNTNLKKVCRTNIICRRNERGTFWWKTATTMSVVKNGEIMFNG